MSGQSSNLNETLWARGHWLSNSWLSFAEPAKKTQYQELTKAPILQTAMDAVPQDQDIQPADKLNVFLDTIARASESRLTLQEHLKGQILKYIRSGSLITYGFEPPRKLASLPVQIEPDMFSGRILWSENELRFQGLKFVEIRLVTRRLYQATLNRQHTPQNSVQPTGQRGRPNARQMVLSALSALQDKGLIDLSAPIKPQVPTIRHHVQLQYERNGRKPIDVSYDTIRKYFNHLRDDLNKNEKL